MSKKKANKKQNKKTVAANDDALPQNIIAVGDCAHEDKCIYISQPVYRNIHLFAEDKTQVESGGVLMGKTIEAFGKTHILISGFIQAKYSTGTPTTFTFTHESWEYIYKEVERYPGQKIIGWIHTHPNFGIFLSENDRFVQQTAFSGENQVAYVIDPINGSEGFFHWKNGAMEQSKGFYLYDRTGVTILKREPEEDGLYDEPHRKSHFLGVVVALLLIACAMMGYFVYMLKREVQTLEEKVASLETRIAPIEQIIGAPQEFFKLFTGQ